MKKVLHVILISLFSLTIISCAKKSNSSSSDTTDTTVESCTTTTTGTTTQMGGSRQGVELCLSTVVTTLAGKKIDGGGGGSEDGTGTSASFNSPLGITTDGTNLYVADGDNHLIRKIVISTGAVTKVAGTGYAGSHNDANCGTVGGCIGSESWFRYPGRITTDGTNLYVLDMGNNLIRKIE